MDNELEQAIYEYRTAVIELVAATKKAIASHKNKIEAVEALAPFLKETIRQAQK